MYKFDKTCNVRYIKISIYIKNFLFGLHDFAKYLKYRFLRDRIRIMFDTEILLIFVNI